MPAKEVGESFVGVMGLDGWPSFQLLLALYECFDPDSNSFFIKLIQGLNAHTAASRYDNELYAVIFPEPVTAATALVQIQDRT